MPMRFDPTAEMRQESNGVYVTHDEYTDLKKELLEAATDFIIKVGTRELSKEDATVAMNVLARMLTA